MQRLPRRDLNKHKMKRTVLGELVREILLKSREVDRWPLPYYEVPLKRWEKAREELALMLGQRDPPQLIASGMFGDKRNFLLCGTIVTVK